MIREALYTKLKEELADTNGNQKQKGIVSVKGCLKDVVLVDQTPIGRMSRSNLATYIGVFGEIRKAFANLPQAKEKHITAELLSFNVYGGRCEECKGMGMVERNVYFVYEVLMKCQECQKAHNILFLLDEPTAGLHFDDIRRLLELFSKLVDSGNSIICIEHNMDVIKSADHIIDIGPDGGKRGGKIVCTGTPDKIMECRDSYTGKELRNYLCKYPAVN